MFLLIYTNFEQVKQTSAKVLQHCICSLLNDKKDPQSTWS